MQKVIHIFQKHLAKAASVDNKELFEAIIKVLSELNIHTLSFHDAKQVPSHYLPILAQIPSLEHLNISSRRILAESSEASQVCLMCRALICPIATYPI